MRSGAIGRAERAAEVRSVLGPRLIVAGEQLQCHQVAGCGDWHADARQHLEADGGDTNIENKTPC